MRFIIGNRFVLICALFSQSAFASQSICEVELMGKAPRVQTGLFGKIQANWDRSQINSFLESYARNSNNQSAYLFLIRMIEEQKIVSVSEAEEIAIRLAWIRNEVRTKQWFIEHNTRDIQEKILSVIQNHPGEMMRDAGAKRRLIALMIYSGEEFGFTWDASKYLIELPLDLKVKLKEDLLDDVFYPFFTEQRQASLKKMVRDFYFFNLDRMFPPRLNNTNVWDLIRFSSKQLQGEWSIQGPMGYQNPETAKQVLAVIALDEKPNFNKPEFDVLYELTHHRIYFALTQKDGEQDAAAVPFLLPCANAVAVILNRWTKTGASSWLGGNNGKDFFIWLSALNDRPVIRNFLIETYPELNPVLQVRSYAELADVMRKPIFSEGKFFKFSTHH